MKKEAQTDLWVARQLDNNHIKYDAQGSSIIEISEALKTASKRGTGHVGFPEYVCAVEEFIIVIEDKSDINKHLQLLDNGLIDQDILAIQSFAVNGALFYAKHIAQNSSFKKIFAVGVSGCGRFHRITPLYVDDRGEYKQLDDVETFAWFSPDNIKEYYTRYVLNDIVEEEKTAEQILKDAEELHNYLRTYGALRDQEKPLVVSGILLALDMIDSGGFSIGSLTGDKIHGMRDGDKILNAIKGRLIKSNVGPDAKKDKVVNSFNMLTTNERLNEINNSLNKTPLKFFTEFLYNKIFNSIKYVSNSEDFIGRFYGEFMHYSGGDGQSLGIILTPRHITDLMCDLVSLTPNDIVLDPTCGTAGFLISAMYKMVSETSDEQLRKNIKKKQLHGIEIQDTMFTVAVTNMILRKDGNSNLLCCDFLKQNPSQLQLKGATVGLMNPPYSMATKLHDDNQYELFFVEHLLNSLVDGARCAVIIPQTCLESGRSITAVERRIKENLLKKHTLEGVITCNPKTFGNGSVGVAPAIAIFTAHEPHPKNKVSKFIDFRNDGYVVKKNVGLVADNSYKDKLGHLLDTWKSNEGDTSSETTTKFCVNACVSADDEWLHQFYYYNDERITELQIEKAVSDYLSFKISLALNYPNKSNLIIDNVRQPIPLSDKQWKPYSVDRLFDRFEKTKGKKTELLIDGEDIPYIAAAKFNNGFDRMCKNSNPEWVSNGNCIVFVTLGDGAAGLAYYIPMNFIGMNGKTECGYSVKLNEFNGVFIACCLSVNKSRFSHDYTWTGHRLRKTKVMLPSDEYGEPDYEYMENYIKDQMYKKIKSISWI